MDVLNAYGDVSDISKGMDKEMATAGGQGNTLPERIHYTLLDFNYSLFFFYHIYFFYYSYARDCLLFAIAICSRGYDILIF